LQGERKVEIDNDNDQCNPYSLSPDEKADNSNKNNNKGGKKVKSYKRNIPVNTRPSSPSSAATVTIQEF